MDYEWVITQIFRHIFNITFREEFFSEVEYKEELKIRLKKAFSDQCKQISYEEKGEFWDAFFNRIPNSTEFDEFEKEIIMEVMVEILAENL